MWPPINVAIHQRGHPSTWPSINVAKEIAKGELIIMQDAIGQRPRVKLALVEIQGRLRNLCLDYNGVRKHTEAFFNIHLRIV